MPSHAKGTHKRSANDNQEQDRKEVLGNMCQNLSERLPSNLDGFKLQFRPDGSDGNNSNRLREDSTAEEVSPSSSESSSLGDQRDPCSSKENRSPKPNCLPSTSVNKNVPRKRESVSSLQISTTASTGKILKRKRDISGHYPANIDLRTDRADSLPLMSRLSKADHVEIVKALKKKVPGIVRGKKTVVAIGGDDMGEFSVQRIMDSRGSGKELEFLVKWCNWNFTTCTWQSLSDLENCPIALKQFAEKEKALQKVFENIKNNPHYANYKFERFVVPCLNGWLSDEELEEMKLAPYFRARIGYWKTKLTELSWMDTLDPCYDLEESPLYLESWLPRSKGMQFEFIASWKISPGAEAKIKELERERLPRCKMGCSCAMTPKCQRCLNLVIHCKLDRNGIVKGLRANKDLGQARVLYQCSDDCPCSKKDKRVIKTTRPYPLLVFEDPMKGWCVRAVTAIPKGAIISEYLGRIETELESGKDDSYVFGLEQGLVNNARHYGNESRFFSHSCEPNMMVLQVYKNLNSPIHQIMMVTVRTIQPGEELTFDYHPRHPTSDPSDTRKEKRPTKGFASCRCLSTHCRKWV